MPPLPKTFATRHALIAHVKTLACWAKGEHSNTQGGRHQAERKLALPEVEILCGATEEVLRQIAPRTLLIPATPNPFVRDVAAQLSAQTTTEWLSETPFAIIRKPPDYRRFFQYWKQAGKTAFQTDGGAPHG